jgi:outer membrane protein assembly factor BamB
MFTLACLITLQTATAQWPQWRGPNRDGFCAETNLLKTWPAEGPKLLWATDSIIGDGFSSAIIQDKTIYTTGKKDSIEVISALDLNGNLLWQKEFGKAIKADWPESRSTPTFYKNKLYALTNTGDMSCLDAKTGALVWKINLRDKFEGVSTFNGFGESPLVVDDKVVLSPCGKKTTLVALNSANGETLWTSESVADTNNYVSPVLIESKDKKLVVTSVKKNMVAVDLYTGKIVWKKEAYSALVPLPDKKQIYFSSFMGGKMVRLNEDLSGADVQWTDTMKASYMGGSVRLGNQIFSTFDNNKSGIFSLNWETGTMISLNKEIKPASLLAADGMIYSYEDRSGKISLLKPNDNSIDLVSSFKVMKGKGPNLAHMSVANGMLFVRHGKHLVAYDIKHL